MKTENRLAIISDLHGNYPALEAVLSDIKKDGITDILCLGDILGFYSMINETIDLLLKNNVMCIIGNHDYALLYNNGEIARSKTCTKILKRQINALKPEYLSWLKTLKTNIKFRTPQGMAMCVHGGLSDPIDEYLYDLPYDYLLKNECSENILLHGHTHLPRFATVKNGIVINPGSVGQPRDNDPRASYCVMSETNIQFIRIPYDLTILETHMIESGYEEYVINVLKEGKKIS